METHLLPLMMISLSLTVLFVQPASTLVVNSFDLQHHHLLPRDTSSDSTNLTPCGQGLPSNFLCSTGTTCISLINTNMQASAICCPSGSDCSLINIITCDTSLQDPAKYPGAPVHSTNTSQQLPTCGSACCPLGYECVVDTAQCRIQNVAKQPAQSSTTIQSATASATGSSNPATQSTTPTNAASATSSPNMIEPKQTNSPSKAGLVFAGLIPGLVVGAALTLGILYFLRKRREKHGYKSDAASSFFGPPTPFENRPPKISEPIYKPGMSDRVVFGHNRTLSNTLPETNAPYDGFYGSINNVNRTTTDSATLVSPPASKDRNDQIRPLDPPFETPTKPGRSAGQQKSFFSTSSKSSKRDTQRTTGSMETISMLMGPPRVVSYQRTPVVRQTTYSDVYRAAGVSPSQIKSARPSVDTQRH